VKYNKVGIPTSVLPGLQSFQVFNTSFYLQDFFVVKASLATPSEMCVVKAFFDLQQDICKGLDLCNSI
jgi:hypothetical protein